MFLGVDGYREAKVLLPQMELELVLMHSAIPESDNSFDDGVVS